MHQGKEKTNLTALKTSLSLKEEKRWSRPGHKIRVHMQSLDLGEMKRKGKLGTQFPVEEEIETEQLMAEGKVKHDPGKKDIKTLHEEEKKRHGHPVTLTGK